MNVAIIHRGFLASVVACLLSLACVSCVETHAPPAVAKTGDYGKRPSREDCRRIVQTFIKETFKDPYSVRDLEIGEPSQYSRFRGIQNGGGYYFAYLLPFRCNAKNSYGAYTGVQTTTLVVRNGKVVGRPEDPVWEYFGR